jgi:hypothetical protein
MKTVKIVFLGEKIDAAQLSFLKVRKTYRVKYYFLLLRLQFGHKRSLIEAYMRFQLAITVGRESYFYFDARLKTML